MIVYKFYSDFYDRHNRYNELKSKGIDSYNEIPKEFRSQERDYIVIDIECPQFYKYDNIQIFWDGEKQEWCYGTVGSSFNRNQKIDVVSWAGTYGRETLKESTLPEDIDNEFKELLIILALLKGGEEGGRDEELENRRQEIVKKLGF